MQPDSSTASAEQHWSHALWQMVAACVNEAKRHQGVPEALRDALTKASSLAWQFKEEQQAGPLWAKE